ncbi:hypothetical protein THH46_21360 [Pseudomonas sp. NA13]
MDAAGFDKLSNVVSLNGLVGTAGLGNCIAVAGFNTGNGRMAMAHYNTLFVRMAKATHGMKDRCEIFISGSSVRPRPINS